MKKMLICYLLLVAMAYAEEPETVFRQPPESAKPGVWWHWMGCNISKKGITRDLEAFRDAGIGGATIFGMADVCTPWAGHIDNSPNDGLLAFTEPWWTLVRHAAEEGRRLGIDVGIHNCPGYTSTGGPWITPELAMQQIFQSATPLEGGIAFEGVLPRPAIDPRGDVLFPMVNKHTGQLEKPIIPGRTNYWRDVAVLAVPAEGVIALNQVIDLTARMDTTGKLAWTPPPGKWIVYRFGHTTMGALTQPNQWEVMGLECDKMSEKAVTSHLQHVLGELNRHLGPLVGTGLKHVLLDSYEAGTPSWTPRMTEEFGVRRGYDLRPFLPTFAGRVVGSDAETRKFKADFNRTIADLYRDVLFATMAEMLADANLRFVCEPYGGPFHTAEVAPYVHRVMTEFWSGDAFGHAPMNGIFNAGDARRHNILEAEAFTGGPGRSQWTETPSWLKPVGDGAFCAGINRFVLHTNPHQPWEDDIRPGMTMGQWGTHFGRTQTWWEPGKAWIAYLTRCQALLQWGETAPLDFAADGLPLRAIHRHDATADVWFVANPERTGGEALCAFRVSGKQPELWDPVTGTMRALHDFEDDGGETTVTLEFAPAQSWFVVFRKKVSGVSVQVPGRNFPEVKPVVELAGPWSVSFDPKWGGPESVTFDKLEDWAKRPEPGIRYYSGTATYRTTFDGAHAALLDLGVVNDIARVRLNGRDLGVLWTAPWSVSIPPGLLKPTGNELEIDVTNVWRNRLIGDEQEPADCEWLPGHQGHGGFLKCFPDWFVKGVPRPSKGRYCFTTWNYFTSDSPLAPSGLLGPVRVMAEDWTGERPKRPASAVQSRTGNSLEADLVKEHLVSIASVTEEGVAHAGGGTNADALLNGTTHNGSGGDETLDDGKTFRGYGAGSSLTLRLAKPSEVAEIRTFAGHPDGRASQSYTVLIARAANPEQFERLTSAFVRCNGGASEVRIKAKATGVVGVRFEFQDGPQGFNVYREICLEGPSEPVVVSPIQSLDDCNVVWNSPSADSFGSMPLGNGDVGLNAWVERSGDLLLYISKVDAFDAGHLLPKLGRVRVRFEPALDVKDFRQTLVLRDAAIEVKAGDANVRMWVDANAPIVRVQGRSATPRKATITFESLRAMQNATSDLPGSGTAGVLFEDKADRLAWCYRNQSSVWAGNFASQNTPEMVAKTKDPILHRTSGCMLRAADFVRAGNTSLSSRKALQNLDCTIRVLSSQPDNVAAWLADAERPVKSDWPAHRKYWQSFWDRSHIFIPHAGEGSCNLDQYRFTQFPQARDVYEGHKEIQAAQNVFQISQRYALERFCEAAASRGGVPPPYNGSIFTMDMPAGVMGFDRPKPNPVSPDGRDWAQLSFMWQNTRHPYWSMAARGDYDTHLPGMNFVRNSLDIARDRCRKLYGIDGAVIFEASWWHNVGVFPFEGLPGHLRFHQLATIEIPAIMAETYAHTRDEKFLRETLLPCAEEGLKFYFNRFPKTDARGRILMEGVGCAETYQGVTNPATEIGCMKFLLDQLLSFPIDARRRALFTKWRAMLPDVPVRRIRGMDLLAVGEVHNPGRTDCETPELYSIYPFRQAWLGTPEKLAMARQSFHVRNVSLDGTVDWQPVETGGWQCAPVQAAHLGLAREAARLASINFHDRFAHWSGNITKGPNGELMRGACDSPGFVVGDPNSGLPFPYRPRPRFPGFWECKMDGTPDNDHGANSVNTLQSMLLQCDGKKIYLLPAWPEDWGVSFKLCANDNTTVECVYRSGKVVSLTVTPKSRLADIVDFSTPEARIRTLVDVACADRNWLFDLPPMLDGLPTPGPVTGPWLAKFGESVTGVRGAPWPNCVFRDRVLYVHHGGTAPTLPAHVVSSTRLSDTILKVEYDQPIEPLARAAVSEGSLTTGTPGTEVDFGHPRRFDRLEFTIDNPGYRRGQRRAFELQIGQADGTWRTVHAGHLFGRIYAKEFTPVTAQRVRLNINAEVVQFDVFDGRN